MKPAPFLLPATAAAMGQYNLLLRFASEPTSLLLCAFSSIPKRCWRGECTRGPVHAFAHLRKRQACIFFASECSIEDEILSRSQQQQQQQQHQQRIKTSFCVRANLTTAARKASVQSFVSASPTATAVSSYSRTGRVTPPLRPSAATSTKLIHEEDGLRVFPSLWCPSASLLALERGLCVQPSTRWISSGQHSRSSSDTNTSDDSSSSSARQSPVLAAYSGATGDVDYGSNRYYGVVLTALLSSAALLAVDCDQRRRRTFTTECDPAPLGAPTLQQTKEEEKQLQQQQLGLSLSAAVVSSSPPLRERLRGLRRLSVAAMPTAPWYSPTGDCCYFTCKYPNSVENNEVEGHSKGNRSRSSRSTSIDSVTPRIQLSPTKCYLTYMHQCTFSYAARKPVRDAARCAAAEGGLVSSLLTAVNTSETQHSPARKERKRTNRGIEIEQDMLERQDTRSVFAPHTGGERQRKSGETLKSMEDAMDSAGAESEYGVNTNLDRPQDARKAHVVVGLGKIDTRKYLQSGEPAREEGVHQQQQHQHHDSPLWRSEENRPFERKLEDALLFCGNSNQPLAAAVADRLSTKLGKVAVKRFADGEVNIQFLDSLRGKDVYLIQPTSTPADVARMIEAMGVDRVVAVDLHCGQIQGFFGPRVPVDNLEAQIIGLEYFQHKNLEKPVVVSPDAGGVYRARKFQEGLLARGYRDCGIAMLIKQRLRANEIERMDLVGSVEGSDVIIVDDMIDTAGTLCEAARELRAKGARRVFAFATHGLFSGPAIHRIESSPLEEVVVTDSIQARREVLSCPRITSLSISVLLADAIRRIHQKESLNDLFIVRSWQ